MFRPLKIGSQPLRVCSRNTEILGQRCTLPCLLSALSFTVGPWAKWPNLSEAVP